MSKDNGFPCDHPTLRSGDTFDQLRRVEPCLYCERDALAARLAEAERERDEAVARMEAGWIEVAEGPVSKHLRERLAEAKRLLQAVWYYADEGIDEKIPDRLRRKVTAFLTPDSASAAQGDAT